MNARELSKLYTQEEKLLKKIERSRAKLRKAVERAEKMYDFLQTIGVGSETRTGFRRYKFSMAERELIFDRRFPLIMAKLLKSI
jgi:hypothetical protein